MEEFVRAWQTSDSAAEVARKLGIETAEASNKGSYLRERGVALQKFRIRTDYKALNDLALSLTEAPAGEGPEGNGASASGETEPRKDAE